MYACWRLSVVTVPISLPFSPMLSSSGTGRTGVWRLRTPTCASAGLVLVSKGQTIRQAGAYLSFSASPYVIAFDVAAIGKPFGDPGFHSAHCPLPLLPARFSAKLPPRIGR
ncbi:hypothetical protein BZA05DRAFT_388893 [Tricharina praecox]|uniref:uncharacterized protein n=1 Tax=Tricharina praecox TaxID=43433 RepID=UPI00221F4F6E|nr:uncharacterized protein BZA05DRAFT_388893 [Tricharina praecox]KAI5856529.1 hypothetical protein BZA05DRAFT_388893 [Tricharina praecox]